MFLLFILLMLGAIALGAVLWFAFQLLFGLWFIGATAALLILAIAIAVVIIL
jgi:hypothetical protein